MLTAEEFQRLQELATQHQQEADELSNRKFRFAWGEVTGVSVRPMLYWKNPTDGSSTAKWPGEEITNTRVLQDSIEQHDGYPDIQRQIRWFRMSKQRGSGTPMFHLWVEINIARRDPSNSGNSIDIRMSQVFPAWSKILLPSLRDVGYENLAMLDGMYIVLEQVENTYEDKMIRRVRNDQGEWDDEFDADGQPVMVYRRVWRVLAVCDNETDAAARYKELLDTYGDNPDQPGSNEHTPTSNGSNGQNGGVMGVVAGAPNAAMATIALQKLPVLIQQMGVEQALNWLQNDQTAKLGGLTTDDPRVRSIFAEAGHPLS